MTTWRHRIGLLLWCGAALTCGSHDPGGQSVTLVVRYPAHLSLDHLTLAAELPMDPPRQVRATAPNPPRALDPQGETLGLTVPDTLASGVMAVLVEGWAGDVLAARQQMMLAVPLDAQLVTIDLEAVPASCGGASCDPVCGDGAVDPGEACDDGGQRAADGCSSACTLEDGWRCEGAPSTCTEECPDGCETCGDGVVQASETCDDGARDAGDGCNANCSVETGWSCEGEPSVCAELCPGGCPVCGDGVIHDSEGCDDGGVVAGDGCDSGCQLEAGWVCEGEPSICTEECPDGCPACGDGVIQASEGCDDGAREAGDGCDSSCQLETGWECVGEPSRCDPDCRDGLVRGDEACDDGNSNNRDGCTNACNVQSGYMCVGEPSSCSPICGDGQILAEEACDDDNSAPGDGCDDQCQVEAGYSCAGEPSVCTANEPADAGVPEDAGPSDTGVHPDAEPADAGVHPDAQPTDSGVHPDAAPPPDSGPSDSGVHPDAAPPPDSGPTDSGVHPDAQPPADSGVHPDAEPPPDSGPSDSGEHPDAAPPPDSGPPPIVATQWAFLGAPAQFVAGTCTPMTLQRQASDGSPAPETSRRNAIITVVQGTGVALYSDAGCLSQTTVVGFDPGVSDRPVYFAGSTANAFELQAAGGLTAAVLASTVVPGPPSRVRLVGGSTTLSWFECGGTPATLELRDAMGNLTTSASPTSLQLSTSPTEALLLSSSSGCATESNQITLPANQSSIAVYWKARRLGAVSVTVAAAGLTSGTGAVTVNSASGSCLACSLNPGACLGVCQGGSGCSEECLPGCNCQIDCNLNPGGTCRPTCESGATCLLDCRGVGECEADCESNSDCTVECDNTTECDKTNCESGAECLLSCGTTAICEFDTCPTGQMTCPDNITVCNRACP